MRLVKGKYASYLEIEEERDVARTEEIADNIYADYDKDGKLLGIEFVRSLEIIEEKDDEFTLEEALQVAKKEQKKQFKIEDKERLADLIIGGVAEV